MSQIALARVTFWLMLLDKLNELHFLGQLYFSNSIAPPNGSKKDPMLFEMPAGNTFDQNSTDGRPVRWISNGMTL